MSKLCDTSLAHLQTNQKILWDTHTLTLCHTTSLEHIISLGPVLGMQFYKKAKLKR